LENPGADDSDVEQEEKFGIASNEASAERAAHDDEINRAVGLEEAWADCIKSYQGELELEWENAVAALTPANTAVAVPGAPPGWMPPSAPDDWVPAAPKTSKKEPNMPFEEVDNPGNLTRFCFWRARLA